MRSHTPGPWKIVNGVDVQSGPIGCLAYVSTAGARGRTYAEAEANARLIAAAPALEANLRCALWHLENPGVPIADGALQNIRDVLALADSTESTS